MFPLNCVPVSGKILNTFFLTNGHSALMMDPIESNPDHPVPDHIRELQKMNQCVQHQVPLDIVAQAIWNGIAIMGIDGSVKGQKATYSWVTSTQQDDVRPDISGSGFLPTTPAQHLNPYSKRTEAAALYAGIT